jgi:hypothetical protein
MRANDFSIEGVSHPKLEKILVRFIPFAQKRLGIKELPKIIFLDTGLDGTFGKYHDGNIRVVAGNRHVIDVLRTLAHELVHWRQELRGELGPKAGHTGSPQENEANSVAGIVMRHFDHAHPDLLKDLRNET